MSRRSWIGVVGPVVRQMLAAPAPAVLVALVVAAAAFTAVAAPRAVSVVHTQALDEAVDAAPRAGLDLASETQRSAPTLGPAGDTTLPGDVAQVWGQLESSLLAARDEMPEALRGVFGAPRILLSALPVETVPAGGPGATTYRLQTSVDPRMREHLTITAGAWPAPVPRTLPADEPFEIVLTEAVAEEMAWRLDEVRTMSLAGEPQAVRLAGLVEPADPGDPFWEHARTALDAELIVEGESRQVTGIGFVDPASWPSFSASLWPIDTQLWFPLREDRLEAHDAGTLVAQLRAYGAESRTIGPDDDWATIGRVSFTSDLRGVLEDSASAARTVDAVLTAVAAGPAGVAAAVLVLAAGVVFTRRREGLELAAARGASPAQLRAVLAAEGVAMGLPAAVGGGLLGVAAVPAGAPDAVGWVVAGVFGCTPAAALLVAAGGLTPLRRVRADLGVRRRGATRILIEALVVALAAAAVLLLLYRGLDPQAAGVDPLLAATPLLLAAAASVGVLRLYPLPLRALVARLTRSPRLVSFLGAARALRDPQAGVVPVLAVVVGLAVAVFSSIVLTTVRGGIDTAAQERTGADVRVSGPPLTEQERAELGDIPGIAAIAPVYSDETVALTYDGRSTHATLYVVDAAEMRGVQSGSDGATPLPDGLAEVQGDVPAVISAGVASVIDDARDVTLGDGGIDVRAEVDGPTAYGGGENWIVIDRANAELLTRTLVPSTVLLRVADGADPAAVIAAIGQVIPDSTVTTPDSARAALEDRPSTQGLLIALIVALVVSSLLMAAAIALTLVAGSSARRRLLPLLTTLGLGRRGERALVVWEIAPTVIVASLGGIAVGILLPFAVLGGIDLATFTTAAHQPAVRIDPLLIGGVLLTAVTVTAVSILTTVQTAQHAGRSQTWARERMKT